MYNEEYRNSFGKIGKTEFKKMFNYSGKIWLGYLS